MNNQVTIIKPEDKRKTVVLDGNEYRYFATGKETNGRYFCVEGIIPPGSGEPTHIQSNEEELDYILEGEMTFWLDNEEVIAPKGTYINIPKGVKHSFRNQTNKEARILFLTSPAGIEGLLDEVAENAEIANHPEGPIAGLNEVGKKYGFTVFEE